jgi:hypothetical protein
MKRKSLTAIVGCKGFKEWVRSLAAFAPSKNAGKAGSEWQVYDLTLVDRHMTVILNGEKVIDNQPVHGLPGGAPITDPTQPGPIHLQGDHPSVAYRNIYLAPLIIEQR